MSTLNLISAITYSSNLDVRSLSSAGKISKQAPIDKTCPSGDTSRTLPTIITFCQHFKAKEVDFIITLSPFQRPAIMTSVDAVSCKGNKSSFRSPIPCFALGFHLHSVYFSCSQLSFDVKQMYRVFQKFVDTFLYK